MHRYAMLLLCVAAALTVGIVSPAAGEETDLTADVGFSPKALSKTSYTPIRLSLSQKVHAPAAERELLIELDKNVMVRTEGVPACHPGGPQTGVTVEEACGDAIVGSGEETALIALPEETPTNASARVQILNGGEREGAITLWVYSRFAAPISGSLLTKVVFTRVYHGRFGWLADLKLPQIVGGSGSIIHLRLTIGRGVLSARCSDGKLRFHAQTFFEDGTTGETESTRACTAVD